MWVAVPAYTGTHNSAAGHLLTGTSQATLFFPELVLNLNYPHGIKLLQTLSIHKSGQKHVPGPDELLAARGQK